MDTGFGADSFDTPIQSFYTPFGNFVRVTAEYRLIELNDGRAQRIQIASLVVQRPGNCHGQCPLISIVLVKRRIDHSHRTGQRHFQRATAVRHSKLKIVDHDRCITGHLPRTAADLGQSPIVSHPLLGWRGIVKTTQPRHNVRQIRGAALFTIADHVYIGFGLVVDRDPNSIVLRLFQ